MKILKMWIYPEFRILFLNISPEVKTLDCSFVKKVPTSWRLARSASILLLAPFSYDAGRVLARMKKKGVKKIVHV